MIQIPLEIGDTILTGRFKNKKVTVKEIGTDEYGNITVNGRSILKIRIPKLYQKQENNMKLKESSDDTLIQNVIDTYNHTKSGKMSLGGKREAMTYKKIADKTGFITVGNSGIDYWVMMTDKGIKHFNLKSKNENTLKEANMSSSEMKQRMLDGIQKDGTAFEIRGAYGNCELWANGTRLEAGSVKDCYNAWIKYRFNPKYEKKTTTNIDYKDDVVKVLNLKQGEKYISIMGSEPLEVEYIGRATNPVNHKFKVLKHNDEYVLNPYDVQKYIKFPLSENKSKLKENNNTNFKVDDIILKYTTKSKLQPLLIKIAEIASTYWSLSVQERNKIYQQQENEMKTRNVYLEEKDGKYFVMSEIDKVPVINPYGYNTKQHAAASAIFKGFVVNEMKTNKKQENEMKTNETTRSIGPMLKIGFNFTSLNKGDEIKNKKNKETYIVTSVGSDGATLKHKWLDKYMNIESLKDFEPVKVKSMAESVTPFQKSPIEVKIKQNDGAWHIYLQTVDGEQQLSIQGWETKEQAEHAAMMKGYKYDGNPYFEKHKGIEVPKATKSEPVKHDKPKEMDLGKEKELKLENFIRKVIRTELSKKKSS